MVETCFFIGKQKIYGIGQKQFNQKRLKVANPLAGATGQIDLIEISSNCHQRMAES
jgi:hypothetical protein